ncbi:amidase family protein [Frankia sp. QA3]|uniref:amidase family protein n=1 Tax=Frankia sp. QA3 TaxID=710111 RepID=UPI000269BB4F|nr:amidase family protein [Frankia sp. QA3]EIV91241.1 amidase, Asp-tRNAAsn/Glu-tRNAGln amidotransferase A subunit [Frankia sp. QA3]
MSSADGWPRAVWRDHGDPLLAPTGSGPLDGLRVAVKDLFAVGGYRIGAGNPRWLAEAPVEPADAEAVRALRAAGAAIAGIAQTDELAFSLSGANVHYGTPPNPAAPDRVTGGSSSGPASAVAAGWADVGLGTDTAGSIRVPASVCGLYGLRPTRGAVAAGGVLGLAPSFDTVGWLTADPGLLRAVGEVLLPPSAPPGPPGPPGPPARLLVAVPAAGTALRRLADALGADLDAGPVRELDDVPRLLAAFRAVQAAEAWRLHGAWIGAHPGALGADVEARFRFGAGVDADAERDARREIAAGRERLLDRLGADTWLALPAAAGPGHLRGSGERDRDTWRQATLGCTVVASAYGLPSCVVPDPITQGGAPLAAVGPRRPLVGPAPVGPAPVGPAPVGPAPVGLALVGPPGADRALLDAAAAAGTAVS